MQRVWENTIGLWTIIQREVTRFMRIWTQTLVPPVITIVLYFVIFGHLIGARIGTMGGFQYIEYIVPGLVMMAVITNAYTNVVSSFFVSKFQRNIEEMLVSPLPNALIVWGFVLGGVIRGFMVGMLATGVSACFTSVHIASMGITIIMGILTAMLFSLAGFVNGIFAKRFDDISIVPTFVLTPLIYLGGVFYSIDLLPAMGRVITHANPIFYIVSAFRFGMLGQADVSISLAIGIVALCIVVLYGLSLWLLGRGVGIRT